MLVVVVMMMMMMMMVLATGCVVRKHSAVELGWDEMR